MNETEEHLRARLKEHGYELMKIAHFKKFDRVTFGNREIKVSINLRGKLSELAFETLVEACIGKTSSQEADVQHDNETYGRRNVDVQHDSKPGRHGRCATQ